jgi:hypothetical protein
MCGNAKVHRGVGLKDILSPERLNEEIFARKEKSCSENRNAQPRQIERTRP